MKNRLLIKDTLLTASVTVGDYVDIVNLKFDVANQLDGNLMDPHFLNCSPIARRVRQAYLDQGFSFKMLQDPTEMNYFWMCGMYSLVYMYKRKIVCYHKNDDSVSKLVIQRH
jgi:hypothetical protein